MTQINSNTNSCAGKHLTYEERIKIEGYKNLGYSNRAIARSLKRAPQTINNAVNRGTVRTIKQRQIITIKYMNTINIVTQLKLIIKSIFGTTNILDDVQSG